MDTIDDFLKDLLNASLTWTKRAPATFEAVFKGEPAILRLNDFPDEVAFTLLVRGDEIDLEERPKGWHLAPAKQG